MALLRRHRPLLPRPFSSSSSPFPPPPSDPTSSADPQPSPTPSSPLADIRHRLRSFPPTSPLGRIPASPPSPASSPPAAPSLDDVRRSLNVFRNPQPAIPSTSATPSFLDVLASNPTPADPGASANAAFSSPSPFSFGAPRRSLDKPGPAAGLLPGANPFGWKSILSQRQRPMAQPLPERVFGKELKEKAGKGHDGAKEDLRPYSYDEMGKRLQGLRPAGAGKDGEWFSLEELSGRLGRLRETDKEENERAARSGMDMDLLRDAFVTLQTSDPKKTDKSMQCMTLFMGLEGQTIPAYLLEKPQEELLERYFHPDHMSSAEKMKLELQRVRDEFKMSENDCGSARVQVAQLTTKIKHLSATLHKKDKHSRKGLQEMVQRRKKCLKYLRRTDWDSYCLVLSKFGLRDVPEYKAPDYKSKSSTKSKTKRKSKRKMKA